MTTVCIILTFNEAQHLARCIRSLIGVADEIVVVDSYSTDGTIDIALSCGARVIQHEWVNHSVQFNWALTQVDINTDWVFRIDADEYLTPELRAEMKTCLQEIEPQIDGIYCSRRMTFQGKLIQYGGVFPLRVLRLFRYGRGKCENRWMDEHIKVAGPTVDLTGELIDDNLNSLTWWINKHNRYASLAAVDRLNFEYNFMSIDPNLSLLGGREEGVKLWAKDVVYARLPDGYRAFAYFFYRYIIRMGFLDGKAGLTFHFLQGFWYRYLIDAKVAEVRRHMKEENSDILSAIDRILNIRVD